MKLLYKVHFYKNNEAGNNHDKNSKTEILLTFSFFLKRRWSNTCRNNFSIKSRQYFLYVSALYIVIGELRDGFFVFLLYKTRISFFFNLAVLKVEQKVKCFVFAVKINK